MSNFSLSGIFTDKMVIQRDAPVSVFGSAPANSIITVTMGASTVSGIAIDGEWRVFLPSVTVGGPYSMHIRCNNGESKIINYIMCGDVWIAGGQSNMEFPLHASEMSKVIELCPDIKNVWLYNVPRRPFESTETKERKIEACISPDSQWTECTGYNALSFSAVAYYFAHRLAEDVDVPIGIINCNWGNTSIVSWLSEESLRSIPRFNLLLDEYCGILKKIEITEYNKQFVQFLDNVDSYLVRVQDNKDLIKTEPYPLPPYGPKSYLRPAGLYNCMLSKIVMYRTKGILWYQGESDACEGRSDVYKEALLVFFNFLKEKSENHEMYFLNVQLAPYGGGSISAEHWAEICQTQLEITSLEANYAMITIGDCGDIDIHPLKKREVGERLALAALNKCFGKAVEYCGPLPKYAYTENGSIVVGYSHADGGLIEKDDNNELFEIAGQDGVFCKADKQIYNSTIKISSEHVPNPTAVRYAWDIFPKITLYNTSGYPASLFSIKLIEGKYV